MATNVIVKTTLNAQTLMALAYVSQDILEKSVTSHVQKGRTAKTVLNGVTAKTVLIAIQKPVDASAKPVGVDSNANGLVKFTFLVKIAKNRATVSTVAAVTRSLANASAVQAGWDHSARRSAILGFSVKTVLSSAFASSRKHLLVIQLTESAFAKQSSVTKRQ